MIPLDSTNIDDKLIYTRDCGCEMYCEKCSVILTLHARCTGENNVTVYARDLVVAEGAQLGSPVITGTCYVIATFVVPWGADLNGGQTRRAKELSSASCEKDRN